MITLTSPVHLLQTRPWKCDQCMFLFISFQRFAPNSTGCTSGSVKVITILNERDWTINLARVLHSRIIMLQTLLSKEIHKGAICESQAKQYLSLQKKQLWLTTYLYFSSIKKRKRKKSFTCFGTRTNSKFNSQRLFEQGLLINTD